MKQLLDSLDKAYANKESILANKEAYNYIVKVPHEHITKSYQEHKLTCYISVTEMPDSWLFGNDGYGINNISDKRFINFNTDKLAEVKQKIMEKTGYTNIEVPFQQIWLSIDPFSEQLEHKGVNYQLDHQGNQGYIQGCWHPNPENYNGTLRFFYKTTVELKHTNITYTEETRFDEGRYNRDITRADEEIANYENRIDHILSTNQKRLEQLKLDITNTEKAIKTLETRLDAFRDKYNLKKSTHEKQEEINKHSIEKKIDKNNDSLADILEVQKKEIAEKEVLFEKKTIQLKKSEEEMNESEKELKELVKSASMQQRANVLAKIYESPEEQYTVELIKDAGFDPIYLAFCAIEKNSMALIKLALEYKVDFGSDCCNDKSLLQYLIKGGNQDLIKFILSLEKQDFGASLFASIDHNDVDSLTTILKHNPHLAGSLHEHGRPLLHYAISLNKIDIINIIISIDPTTVDIRGSNGESPFAMALRRDDKDIIKLLLPHINLQKELTELLDNNGMLLIDKLSKMTDLGLQDKENVLINQVLNNEEMNPISDVEVNSLGDSAHEDCST